MDCHEKIERDYVLKLLEEVTKSIKDIQQITLKSFDSMSEVDRYATRYCLIVLAEALASLAIHIARRLYCEKPETSAHAFLILRDKGLITVEEYENLVEFLRLRNLLVHRYWVIDDKEIYNNIKKDFRYIHSFIDKVKRFIEGD